MSSVAKYIGLPFANKGRGPDAYDCWGLLKLFYLNEMGLVVPSYDGDYEGSLDRRSVSEVIEANLHNWQPVKKTEFGDMLVFNILGLPLHVGIFVGRRDFLHAFQNTNSCVERMNSVTWERRLLGIYRWAIT